MPDRPLSYQKYWIAFVLWFMVWSVVHAGLLIHFGIDQQLAWADSFYSNLLLAFVCFDITFILRYYHSKRMGWYMPLLWSAGLAALSLIAMNYFVTSYYAEDTAYMFLFQKTLPVRFVLSFIMIGAFVMLDRLMHYIRVNEESKERTQDLEKLSKEAELSMLRQQLQPHFLFNTLNSISALMTSKPEEARRMIHQLSDFLRGTVKKGDWQFVDLASELKQLELYLEIEKLRFGHRLETIIVSDDSSISMTLPPLLLQPLVENAIKFGLYDTTDKVIIRIHAKGGDKQLEIMIMNPFDPETAKPQTGTGFGLSSVQRRLYLLFARHDLLQTHIEENTFVLTLKIPQSS